MRATYLSPSTKEGQSMSKRSQPFSVEFLRSVLDYDRETGIFQWKPRPDCNKTWNTRFAGKVAGGIQPNKGKFYWTVGVNNELYFGHTLAWFHVTGQWPQSTVDHEDGNGLNNRFDNLRLASQQQQCFNRKVRKDSASGMKGIYRRGSAYRVHIMLDGKPSTRTFHDLESAKQWHSEMAQRLHGSFAHQPKETADAQP